MCIPLSQKWYTDICGRELSSCVTVSFKMKMQIAKREYHEETGRLVRKDKFRTEESKKEKAKVATAEWRLRNPRAR